MKKFLHNPIQNLAQYMGSLILLASITVYAGNAHGQSFEELNAKLSEHPSVVAIENESVMETELARAERGWSDPVFSLGVNNVPISDPGFDRFLPTHKAIGVRQQIPNFGAQNARSRQRHEVSEALGLRAKYQTQRLEAALTGALADQQMVNRQITLAEKQIKLYQELEEILRGQLASGRPLYFRFSEVDVERADVDRQLNDLRNELRDARARLEWLVGSTPALPAPDLELRIWDGSPASLYPALIADKNVNAAREGIAEKAAAYRPDVGVSLTYQQREEGRNGAFAGDDWFSAGVSVSIPIWASTNQTPRLRAAKAREASAKAQYHDVVGEWRRRLETLYGDHAAAERNIALLKDKVTALREVRRAANRNYESGRGGYEQVLDAEIGGLRIEAQLASEEARLTKTIADINSHMVTP